MSSSVPYLYSVLRLVPDIDRGEQINVGLVLFCRPQRFLKVGFEVNAQRIHQFANYVDPDMIESRLETYAAIAAGEKRGGPVAALDIGERFHWLSNTSNTMIQPGPVHPGMTTDAEATFARLVGVLVAAPEAAP